MRSKRGMTSTRSVTNPMTTPVTCISATKRFIHGVSHGESAPNPVVVSVSMTVFSAWNTVRGRPSRFVIPQL